MSRERRVELFRIGRDQADLIPCEFELPGEHTMLSSHCREKRFSKLILDFRLSKGICDARGTVESKKGAVAWPIGHRPPFPFSAHQTGRADFPHPAFRLASL